MAREAQAIAQELTQEDLLRRFGEIQDERLVLEEQLLHLDAEEAKLLALCDHTAEGVPFTEPFCPVCGGILR